MSKVFVTESGSIDQYGIFKGSGIIGVDKNPSDAVRYPISRGCYRHRAYHSSIDVVIIYKNPDSSEGYRVTSIDVL